MPELPTLTVKPVVILKWPIDQSWLVFPLGEASVIQSPVFQRKRAP